MELADWSVIGEAGDIPVRIYLISAYANLSDQLEPFAKAAGAEALVSKEDLDLELIRTWTEAFWMDCST